MQRRLIRGLSVLSLTWATSSAYALGLGEIDLKSHLSQPLLANIPLFSATEEELASLRVELASPDEFDAAGLDRGQFYNLIKFEVKQDAAGQPTILVYSNRPVDEPFLDFLVKVEWPGGRLVREYTVLLDPPVMMKAGGGLQRTESSSVASSRQTVKEAKQRVKSSSGSAAASSRPSPAPSAVTEAPVDPSAPPPAIAGTGEFRVERNDTLWRIANKVKPDAAVTTDQMMRALLRANPRAFAGGNMNRLKAGAVLRVPVREDIPALLNGEQPAAVPASVAEAVQQANANAPIEQVTDATPATETPATETTQAQTPVTTEAKDKQRLRLEVPKEPSAEKTAGASDAGSEALQRELALAKEEAEVERNKSQELNKRVDELEAQMKRVEEIIALKDQELSHLQQRLQTAGANAEAPAVAPAVAPAMETQSAPVDATASAPAPAASSGGETTAPAASSGAEVAATPTAEQPAVESAAPMPAVEAPTPTETATSTEAAAPVAATTPEASPAAPKPPEVQPQPLPATEPEAFWQQPNFLGIALGGLAVVLGGALFAFRRRRSAEELELAEGAVETLRIEPVDSVSPPMAASVSSRAAAHTPVVQVPHDAVHVGDHSPLEEADVYMAYGQYQQAADVIKHAMERESTGIEYRFKLLQIYAAMKDTASFIDEAETLQIAAGDEHPEVWAQTVALGRELCPDEALFRPEGADDDAEEADAYGGEISTELQNDNLMAAFDAVEPAPVSSEVHSLDFDLDLTPPATENLPGTGMDMGGLDFTLDLDKTIPAPSASMPAAKSAADVGMDFLGGLERVDTLPPSKVGDQPVNGLEMDVMPSLFSSDSQPLEDLSMDEIDEVGTKLDLARAYIDMGDDDGARSILDEVIQEGNAAQKQEAQKILVQIH